MGGNRLEGGLRKVGEEEGRGKGWEVMEAMNGLDGEALTTRSATYSCLQTSQYAYCRKEFSVFPPPRFAGELDGHLRWRPRHADGVEHLRLVDGSR